MDEEWKKQNEGTQEPQGSPGPTSENNQPVQPQSVIQPNTISPAQPADTSQLFTSNQPGVPYVAPEAFAAGSPSRARIIIKISVVILGIIIAAAIIFMVFNFVSSKNSAGNADQAHQTNAKTVSVPADWQVIDTQLHFTLKSPADWGSSAVVAFSDDIFSYNTISIAPDDNSNDPAVGVSVDTGTTSMLTPTNQSDFEKAVTDTSSLAAQGIDKDQIKLTSSKIKINDKEWTEVNTEIMGQFSTTFYLWVDDHAVFLTVKSNDQDSLAKLVSDYLLPMAASIELQN